MDAKTRPRSGMFLHYTWPVARSKTLRSPTGEQPGTGLNLHVSGAVPTDERGPSSAGHDEPHLDAALALQYNSKRLSETRRESIEDHLNECASCRELVRGVVDWGDSTRDREQCAWRGAVLPQGLCLAERYRIERFVAR